MGYRKTLTQPLYQLDVSERIAEYAQEKATKKNINFYQKGVNLYTSLLNIFFTLKRGQNTLYGSIQTEEDLVQLQSMLGIESLLNILALLEVDFEKKTDRYFEKKGIKTELLKVKKELLMNHKGFDYELFKVLTTPVVESIKRRIDGGETIYDIVFSKKSQEEIYLSSGLEGILFETGTIGGLFENLFSRLRIELNDYAQRPINYNSVSMAMEALEINTNKELSELSGVTEKTIVGWKRKISPLGETVLNLLVEVSSLRKKLEEKQGSVLQENMKELEAAREFKKALFTFLEK